MLDTRNERRGNICRTASTYKRDETRGPALAENSSKLSRLRRPGRAALVSGIFMAIFNGLIVLVFLILVAASMAVVGSMIVLALFDRLLSRKRSPGVTPKRAILKALIAPTLNAHSVIGGARETLLTSTNRGWNGCSTFLVVQQRSGEHRVMVRIVTQARPRMLRLTEGYGTFQRRNLGFWPTRQLQRSPLLLCRHR